MEPVFPDDAERAAMFAKPDPSNPPDDYQPECGQPGVRLPPDEAERDEDDDL
jgi:hypothetical protein